MKPFRRMHVVPVDDERSSPASVAGSSAERPLSSTLKRAISRTHDWLLEQQHADGHWVAELEGDTILESEYILLLAFLGQHDVADGPQGGRNTSSSSNLPDGGWAIVSRRRRSTSAPA